MNKKGDFMLAGQTVLWIFKIFLFIFAAMIILAPIGCYINRPVEDGDTESYFVMKKVIFCLKREGFDKTKLNDCMEQDIYGIKITYEDKEIVFNKDKYLNKVFCDKEGYSCETKTEVINGKEYLIEVVVKNE